MSSLTDEWQLKTKENAIKYIVDIENFDRKIRTFRTGRGIHSKCFKIGNSTFQVLVFPGGDSVGVKNCVSVHLENRSNWRVKAYATFSIQNKNYAMILGAGLNKSFSEGQCWGFGQFMSHCRCTRNDLLTQDGLLTLQIDLELLEEEVLPDGDLGDKGTPENVEFLKQVLNNQSAQISKLQSNLESTELEHQSQINELKQMIRNLSLVVTQNTPTPPPKLQIECPVCMEIAKPPMRLKQCGQGHIICDSCHARTEAQAQEWGVRVGNALLARCHTCRQQITGRPSQLEKILGLC